MSKIPTRSAAGAGAASMMSRAALTLIVEGKKLDIPYYERLIESQHDIAKVGVRYVRASDIELRASKAGGKPKVLALHDIYLESGELRQVTKSGAKTMAFCLDRDYDIFSKRTRDFNEIVYTHTCDIEGELHEFGDLTSALRASLSLSRSEAEALTQQVGDYRRDLATRWLKWITLCIAADSLGSRCNVHPSQPSTINQDKYGAVNEEDYLALRGELIRTSFKPNAEEMFASVETSVLDAYHSEQWGRLLKGKWIANFLVNEIIRYRPDLSSNDMSAFLKSINPCLVSTVERPRTADFFERLARLVDPGISHPN